MTAPIGKTVIVFGGFTGPTGTFKQVNILSSFTGPTGTFPIWNQATGPTGPHGTFESVINIGPTGIKGEVKTVIIPGFAGGGGAGSTFDPATQVDHVLSNGNLTATHNANTTVGGVRSTTNKTTGKWYFEMTLATLAAGGGNTGVSLGDTTATYANQASGLGAHGITEYLNSGDIYANGVKVGNGNGGQRVPASGDVIGVSIDVDNKQVWFQNLTSGGTRAGPFTPVTETNYQAMFVTNTAGGVTTINFGASAFTGTVPTGFSAWG